MATGRHAAKRTAHKLNNSSTSSPSKATKAKDLKHNDDKNQEDEIETEEQVELKDIMVMMKNMMSKLEKLDLIETKVKSVEQELRSMKDSIEFAHSEVKDLKSDNEERKKTDELTRQQIEKLEKENEILHKSVIDLKTRSMRDNLVFYNIDENKDENTTDIIHQIMEHKLGMENAAREVKIDRSHRLGKQRFGTTKPRPIVAKFNFYPDRERVLQNARKLKGTKIGIGEQFPDEILKIRKELYPELKKARDAGKKAKLVKDKLIIEGQIFYKPTT
jgi:hypothetical protein